MNGRRQFVAIALVLVLAAVAGFVWATVGPRGQSADLQAQGLSLLDAVDREIRTKFVLHSVDEAKLYEGAQAEVLKVAGAGCARVLQSGQVAQASSGRQRVAALVEAAAQRCTAPRPDSQQLYFAAARGMLDSLGDRYTRFMDPRAFDEFKQDAQGFFFGIGISIDLKEDYPIVVQPIPGTPAARVGLRAGDRITEIDGISANKMPLQEAVARIRGPKGSAVHLVILRGNQSMRVTIVRDRIEIVAGGGTRNDPLGDAARARPRDAGIGYGRVGTFNDNTQKAVPGRERGVEGKKGG